ncbi:hypothetical protein GCM10022226_25400 [Sphaerisporangium flaviroseum]|uniref:Uncharacterized protein n=1 Tax=Sphaerisporangium flaviroseum TaxID=509199 RepID=A0ABP7HWH4_9ACTN
MTIDGAAGECRAADVGIAARNRTPTSFREFTKYGLIVTFVTVTLVTPYVWVRYLM